MKIFKSSGIPGLFLKRINRFVALVKVLGEETFAHVPNTGRMTELLFYGNHVLLEVHESDHRKTKYTLKLVKYEDHWVCIDSIITNNIAYTYLRENYYGELKREVKFLSSRFDFALTTNKKHSFIEAKSVNLVLEGTAYFPDAPTERGRKHLIELQTCMSMGYGAMVLFVVQRGDAKLFKPHVKMDKKFTQELIQAHSKGLQIVVLGCNVNTDEITINNEIDYLLNV